MENYRTFGWQEEPEQPHGLLNLTGRGERIRTSDHVHPMHVRYQAALRPEAADYSKQALLLEIAFGVARGEECRK